MSRANARRRPKDTSAPPPHWFMDAGPQPLTQHGKNKQLRAVTLRLFSYRQLLLSGGSFTLKYKTENNIWLVNTVNLLAAGAGGWKSGYPSMHRRQVQNSFDHKIIKVSTGLRLVQNNTLNFLWVPPTSSEFFTSIVDTLFFFQPCHGTKLKLVNVLVANVNSAAQSLNAKLFDTCHLCCCCIRNCSSGFSWTTHRSDLK